MSRTAESTKAYRAGLCIACLTEPHAPGRPRCDDCDQKRFRTTSERKVAATNVVPRR
ncbi:Uncharacterised protein [Mycobacteroides abscessus subsp. abscessus]|nr:hypothetical protein PROPHIGD36-2_25 [Mycobacterium phage prophiGD36-2]SHY60071.1 Uncharacterised protein [Mycobacteroides abscessus subsp. abscessus]SIA44274.1 Uncharacterised protein [Mycobacteroides abscessus subsp. abscessus]SIA75887.1 Uncharacterised protein [Mycobacteroides abscessus subsp. abscessus]SIA89296.1 Uncharacterised protein [Mycobacteroides abscessus subsp. abscessus]